ncbi:type II toxin-antitoxin system HicA family toxin [Undibacterium sp. TJN25]|uniref:type II toxin-antitoxin system HicA family toxin n=1 Tax=Undibacterium sp. TJN25 TaxID=3413056 RepID=UPI003BEF5DC5
MKAKHQKTLQAIFAKPTSAGIVFADIEALIRHLGGEVRESEGSRVVFELNGKRLYPHRPHPGKEAKRYQVEEVRELLALQGIKP